MIQAVTPHWHIAREYRKAGHLAAAQELSPEALRTLGSNVLDRLMETDAGKSPAVISADPEGVTGHPSVLELAKSLLLEAAREHKRQPWSRRDSSCTTG